MFFDLLLSAAQSLLIILLYAFFTIGLIVLFIYLIAKGYFDRFAWYRNAKAKIVANIFGEKSANAPLLNMMSGLLGNFGINLGGNNSNGISKAILNKDKTILSFKVSYENKIYDIILPYNKARATRMKDKNVYLIDEENKVKILITTIPGLEYYVTANDMNVENITITDILGDVDKKFVDDELVQV